MKTYRVTVCREVWGHIDVEAENEFDAEEKVEEGKYSSEFVQTKLEKEVVYSAVCIDSTESAQADRKG